MNLKSHAANCQSHLDLNCEYQLYPSINTKVGASKVHGKNYLEVGPQFSTTILCIILSVHKSILSLI